jgi:hypothetical protein
MIPIKQKYSLIPTELKILPLSSSKTTHPTPHFLYLKRTNHLVTTQFPPMTISLFLVFISIATTIYVTRVIIYFCHIIVDWNLAD